MAELSFNLLLEADALYPIVVDIPTGPLSIAAVVGEAPLSIAVAGGEKLTQENLIDGDVELKALFSSLTLEPEIT